jgi:glycosyltransferase involved in cell wall biosynthesis
VKLSLVIPVYRNEESIASLLEECEALDRRLQGDLEVVFVVDGSPDDSLGALNRGLSEGRLQAQVVALSRNFGSFAAIMAGLEQGEGPLYAVMAADLQEPPELIEQFRARLMSDGVDVVVGRRLGREDPILSRIGSAFFWWLYRSLVQREMPPGGVDVFACTRAFRDHLLSLRERNSSLVGLVFWLGFSRGEVSYRRRERRHGRSAWSLGRRVRYLLDSSFAFSDLPIRALSVVGVVGMLTAVVLASVVLVARVSGGIPVPGYAATVLTVMFFGGLNAFGLGLLGEYVWRTFENTKGRPGYVVATRRGYDKRESTA